MLPTLRSTSDIAGICRRRVAVTEPAFDAEGLFNEDYLYFYAGPLDARSDAEAGLIWHLLELEPGMEVLDLACGHGRIANALAERGCRVTGLDATPLFLDRARLDAAARGDRKSTRLNSSHVENSYAVFCLKKKNTN